MSAWSLEKVVVYAGKAQRTKNMGYDVFESKISIHWTSGALAFEVEARERARERIRRVNASAKESLISSRTWAGLFKLL